VAGIGVIINPNAKANRKDRNAARVDRMTATVGPNGVVRVTESLEHVREVAREFLDRGIEILGICGGDGSYHGTLTAFHAVYGERPFPSLLPLRAGTINYIADAIGTRRGSPESLLAGVMRDYRRGKTFETTELDVLRVNGAELGFVLGFGTIVNFLRAYYSLDLQGPLAAGRLLGRLMTSAALGTHISRAVFQGVEADIQCDDEPVPFRTFTFFLAATVNRIALGFQPTYMGTRKRGFFHVVCGPIGARRLVRRAMRIYRGFPTGEELLYDNLGRQLTVQFFKPSPWMLDGDILPEADRLVVEVPRRVTMIRS
jgi:diacylglycerol kinase family enzyme